MTTRKNMPQTEQRYLYPLFVSVVCIFCALLSMPRISEGRLTITIPPLDPSVLPGTGNLNTDPVPGATITFVELNVAIPAQHSGGTLSVALDQSTVTKHKGYCINNGTTEDYDIKLLKSDNLGWHQDSPGTPLTRQIDETLTNSEVIDGPWTIVVRCYDNAAYGKLTFSTTASHGNHSVTLTIPRDDNRNEIADGWENDVAVDANGNDISKNYTGSEDDDIGPGPTAFTDIFDTVHDIAENTNDGDGLTVFDEYRGAKLALMDRPTRFSPRFKEIFLKHTDNFLAALEGGNGGVFPFTSYVIDTASVIVNPNVWILDRASCTKVYRH